MVLSRTDMACRCLRSLPIFSPLLIFLSLVLPASSYAQIANPTPPTTSPLTTLQTSTSPFSSPASASRVPASTTRSDASTTPSTDPDDVQDHLFNYYFLIIGVFAVLLCICILYVGRRRKQKAAFLRSQSQRALASDIAGFRARFGRPGRTNGGSYSGSRAILTRVEGLDERGEAPPPYVAAPKAPGIRGTDVLPVVNRASPSSGTNIVELRDMSRPHSTHQPPKYDERVVEDDLGLRGSDTTESTNEEPRSTPGHES